MLRSEDPNAEVRYMVVINEALQRRALERAFEREFDLVAHLEHTTGKGGTISFRPLATHPRPMGVGAPIAALIRASIRAACNLEVSPIANDVDKGPLHAADDAGGPMLSGSESSEAAAWEDDKSTMLCDESLDPPSPRDPSVRSFFNN